MFELFESYFTEREHFDSFEWFESTYNNIDVKVP